MEIRTSGLITRADLLAGGWTAGEIAARRRAGDLVPVRRGVYEQRASVLCRAALAAWERREAVHRLAARAAASALSADAVFSHATAALLLGLPVWGAGLQRVQVTRARSGGGRVGTRLHVHTAALDPVDVTEVEVDGLRVTSPARTAVDIARCAGFEPGVVTGDGSLHRQAATRQDLAEALARVTGRRGGPAAARMVRFVDGRSESAGESRSRVALLRARVERPDLQWEVPGIDDVRVDFAWRERSVVGEFDGRCKYGRLLRPGQDPGEVLWAEKLREDALRALGLAVVRWTWGDLNDFRPVVARLLAQLTP